MSSLTTPISEQLAHFAGSIEYESVPGPIRERAKYLILDAVGIALASTQQRFAQTVLAGVRSMGGQGIVMCLR